MVWFLTTARKISRLFVKPLLGNLGKSNPPLLKIEIVDATYAQSLEKE